MDTILELQKITLVTKDKTILKNINLKVPKGALLAILGESGSGKSTLLKVIDGGENPTSGRVLMTLSGTQVDITELPVNKRDIHLMPHRTTSFLLIKMRAKR